MYTSREAREIEQERLKGEAIKFSLNPSLPDQQRKKNMKYKLVVKDGRGYLHIDSEANEKIPYGVSSVIPLGNSPEIIAKTAIKYHLNIQYL